MEAIGKGLCNVLDVAVGFLKLTEKVTAWVGRAVHFLLTAFRINRYFFSYYRDRIIVRPVPEGGGR